MTTTPLPPLPEVGYLGDDASYGYDANDMTEYATQARADLEAENKRLRAVLKAILDEQDANQGHATLETYDAVRAALESKP